MGLLSEGSPLSWEETKKYADHVRYHGIIQFVNQYKKLKDRKNDCLKWGDEVEYILIKVDHSNRTAKALLKGGDVLPTLQKDETDNPDHPTTWRPEYGAYMVEGTPGKPYGHLLAHFNMVEANMRLRREDLLNLLTEEGEMALSLTTFPLLGCPDFTVPDTCPTPTSGATHSLFFPDEAIFNGHPRFRTLTRNIRERRGEKVVINIPIYKDVNTPDPFIENLTDYRDTGEGVRASKPDHVYMDAMGFGMGCCCLQMTFQACNIDEARHLYDQLAPLCPILLALSAACPVQRGYIVDTDCRWQIIAASVDDRTAEERGLEPLKRHKRVIPKSRYDSIDSYLSPCSALYNDLKLVMDEELFKYLLQEGVDPLIAQHIAHLFIRDPISLFSEKKDQDDSYETDHFENIQSTNWQTMRFKPPPPNSPIGWRVEFRPTEVQLTDFENAAYVVFIVLLTRVILSFNLNFVIPISKVDQNMAKAQLRDAVLKENFFFRQNVMQPTETEQDSSKSDTCKTDQTQCECACVCGRKEPAHSAECSEMSVNEIINGKEGGFIGLIPLINQFISSFDHIDVDTSCTIRNYLCFIGKRASGEIKTTARWMRDFILAHPEYKRDSVVTPGINYDLICLSDRVTRGQLQPSDPPLLPEGFQSKTRSDIPPALQKAEERRASMELSKRASNTKLQDL